ncbi:MAG: leucine-rich repeat protein [Lachnospiraceae bacterium]|nr:leucine-rich repeat protein [Lachnospiraceae bacterium]
MSNNRGSIGDTLLHIFSVVVIFVLCVVPACYILYCVGSVVYVNYIEKPAREKAEQEAIAQRREELRIAAEEEARIAAEQEAHYRDKYEGKIYYEIFGEHNRLAENYEYLGIVYDVYKSGALFVRKSDEQFSIPEVMEYNGTEYPVIGMIGKEDHISGHLESNNNFYLWNEETFPANWKYLFNVCFANGLTQVVIPETVEYYEFCELPYNRKWSSHDYVNRTLEEIIIESKFDPREWCFCENYEKHCYYISTQGYDNVYDENAQCLPERHISMSRCYRYYVALKKVIIPEWVTSIPSGIKYSYGNDYYTFQSITASRIELAPTVTYVDLSAFNNVPLTEFDFYSGVKYDGSIVGWKVKELNLISDYSLPHTVTVADCSELETLYISAATRHERFPAYVIRNCPNLKTVYIDTDADYSEISISGCNSLETVTIVNLPPNGNDAMFSNVNAGFTLKVPAKYVDYYSAIYKDLNVMSCE